jgi:hypothetical protein
MSTSGGRTSGRSAWSNLDSAGNARGSQTTQVRVSRRRRIHHDTREKECVGYVVPNDKQEWPVLSWQCSLSE